MKAVVCWLLLSLVPLVSTAEELPWTPVEIPGLEIVGDATQHLGPWFQGDFGWLNAGKGIWITRDAGRSWTLSLTAPEPRTFYDSCFINDQEGWVVFGLLPHLFHTQDGGATWQPMAVAVIQTSDTPVNPGSLFMTRIYFKDSRQGIGTFVIDSFPHWGGSIVARTEDGGKHWREIARNSSFPQLFGFGDQVWIDSIYSPDFGETFQRISKPREYFDIFLVSPSYGWGLNDTLLENQKQRWEVVVTFDGGFTWSAPIFSRITDRLFTGPRRLCLLLENVGAILWVGSSEADMPSLLYLTYNGGMSWLSYKAPVDLSYKIPVQSEHMLGCNRQRHEIWLVPSGKTTLFYTSIDPVTAVHPSSKLLRPWGAIKKIRKEN